MGKHEKKSAALKPMGLLQITGFLMVTMALSRVLGYVREIVITTNFGQNFETDAYRAAFLIPDFLYLILVGGAFSTAFIPVLSEYVAKGKEGEGWRICNTIFNLVLLLVSVGVVIAYLFTPQLVAALAPGYSAEGVRLTIILTRVMLIQSFFMCLSGIAQGICHVHQQFVAPAIGGLLYNIAIILVGLWLMPYIRITGFAIGVVVGAFLNFIVHLPTLHRIGMRYAPVLDLGHPGVIAFFRLLGPVLFGLSVVYINTFVTQRLGSTLAEGTVSALNNAMRLMQLPIGIFATAIASAVFPTLAKLAATGKYEEYKSHLSLGLRTIFFLLVPATVGMMVLAVPLIRAMFLQQAFTLDNLQMTATALICYSIGIIGYSQQQLLNRGFYAIHDTKSTVLINVLVVLINIALSYLLVARLGYIGLALAYSLAGTISMVILFAALRKRIGPFGGRGIALSLLKTLLAAGVMALAVQGSVTGMEAMFAIDHKLVQIAQVLLAAGVGAGIYGLCAYLLRMEEMRMVLKILRRR